MAAPQDGQPKGKVDLFDALHTGIKTDPNFNTNGYLYRLGRDSKAGLFDLGFDADGMRQKYQGAAEYQGPDGPANLDQDISTVRGLMTMVQNDDTGKGYHPPPERIPTFTLKPSRTEIPLRHDPYNYQDLSGRTRPWGGNKQALAISIGQFYDRHGQLTPLTGQDIENRSLYMADDMTTDRDGNLLSRPILRELKYHEPAYQKEMLSAWGAKPMSRSWVSSLLVDLERSIGAISNPIAAMYDNAIGTTSTNRLKTLFDTYQQLSGPVKASTVTNLYERGVLYPEYGTFGTLTGFKNGEEEQLYSMVQQFKSDEANIRKQAATGNVKAKVAADLIDLYEGIHGKTTMEKLLDTTYVLDRFAHSTSYRRDEQGMFGGGEAISGLIGSLVGQIGPQALLSRGIAKGLIKYGGEALVTRSVAQGMKATLTKAGGRVASWSSMMLPSATMSNVMYDGAREAGYDHEEGMDIAAVSFPMVALTEMGLGSTWMIKSYMGSGGRESVRSAIAQALRKAPDGTSTTQKAMAGISAFWKSIQAGSDNALANTTKNALEAAWKEGAQEGLEESGYAFLEEMQDTISGKYLYAKTRPFDYSISQRVIESFGAGAIGGAFMGSFIGGRRKPMPYDKGIAALVANGKAKDIVRMGEEMLNAGAITEQELGVLKQDVALSQDIMAGLKISDPQVYQQVTSQQDLVTEYAQRSMDIKAGQARLAEIDAQMATGTADNESLAREKQSTQEQIAENQAKVGSILDGTEAVRRLKNDLMATKKVTADSVDRVSDAFRSYADKKRADLETIRVTRGEGIEAINQELDALVSSKPGDTTEAIQTVQSRQNDLNKGGALLREDVQRTLETLSLKKQEVMAEMMKVKPPSSESATDFESMQQLVDELMGEGDDNTRDFLKNYEKQLYRAKPNEPVVQLYEEYKALEAAERAYGVNEGERTRLKEGLPTQKLLDEGYSQEQLMEQFMMTLGGGQDVRDVLSDARQQQETTQPQLEALDQTIKALEGLLTVRDEMTTSMSEVARRLPGSNVAKQVGQDLPAIQQLQQDDSQVYEPARNMDPASLALMQDTLAGLRTERDRLDQQLSRRSEQLAKIRRAQQVLSAKMITMYGAFDPAMGKNKAYVDTMTLLEQEMEKGGDTVDVLIARLKDIISEQLIGNTAKVRASTTESDNDQTQVITDKKRGIISTAKAIVETKEDGSEVVTFEGTRSDKPGKKVTLGSWKYNSLQEFIDAHPELTPEAIEQLRDYELQLREQGETGETRIWVQKHNTSKSGQGAIESMVSFPGSPGFSQWFSPVRGRSRWGRPVKAPVSKTTNISKAKGFLKHALDTFDWGNEKTNMALNYQETGILNQTDFDQWFTEDLFEDPNLSSSFKASGAVVTLTNFVSEVSRARTAALHQAYQQYAATYTKLPNYEQERSALEATSFLFNPDQELTRALIGAKRPRTAEQVQFSQAQEIPRSIAVPGRPGVGKTHFVVPPVVSMLAHLKGRPLHIVVVTPGRSNGKELQAELTALKEEHRIVSIGMHETASVAAMQDVDLIIVDEAHAADGSDSAAFRAMMQSQPNAGGLFLGDPMQAPSIANKDSVFPVEQRMMRTLPLQVTFRQTNIPMISTISELHAQAYKNRGADIMEPRLPSTQFIERTNQGVRFITSSDRQVVASFADHLLRSVNDQDVSSSAMLITLRESDRENALAMLRQDKDLLTAFPMEQLERRVLTMDKGAHSALGLEADIAFVAIKPQDLGSSYTRFLYTALSRGREGAVAYLPTGRSSAATSLPRENTKQNSYEALWSETAARAKAIADDLTPRLPKDGVEPVKQKEPKPVTTSEQASDFDLDTVDGNIPGPRDEGNQVSKSVWYAKVHTNEPGFVPAWTSVMPFNPDFPQNDKALNKRNPAYELRMRLLEQVFANPAAFPVKIVKRVGAAYTSNTGAYVSKNPIPEIHLTADSEAVINTMRQQTVGGKPVEYEQLFAMGATMLGALYNYTQASGSALDQAQIQLRALLEDESWESGTTRPEFDQLPLGRIYSGVRDSSETAINETVSYKLFLSGASNSDWHVSKPYMVPGNAKDAAWVGEDGVARPQVMVDVAPYPGGPLTKVFLTGGDVDATYYTEMYESISEAVGTATTADVLPFSFLQWNRTRLVRDGHFTDPALAKDLIIRDGKPDVIVKRSESLSDWGKHLRSAIETIQANEQLSAQVTKVLRINKNARAENGYDTIDQRDHAHAVASVARVNMPAFTVDLSQLVKTTSKSGDWLDSVQRTKVKPANASPELQRTAVSKVENYFRKVLGNRFVEGSLEFKPRVTTRDGRQLWGVMENGRITLETVDGTVRSGVERHEAAHLVIDYLLDEESYRKVMDEAARLVAKARGIKPWQVKPEDVHEFIAEQYENTTYHTDTLFGRFMRWLKGVMKRWKLYNSAIDDLLYAIEDGAFKDSPLRSSEEVTRYSQKLSDNEALQSASYAMSNVDPAPQQNKISFRNRGFLNEVFADSVIAQGIVDTTAQQLLRESQYQVPTENQLTLPLASLKVAYQKVLGDLKLAAKQVDATGLKGLTRQQILELDANRWNDYKKVMLSNDSIFNTVFQDVFPGIDMEQMLLDGKLYSDEEVSIDENVTEGLSAHVHNTNENLDPFERQSALTELHLQTIRIIKPLRKGGIPVEESTSSPTKENMGVDMQMVQAVMVDAAQMSQYSAEGLSSMEIMARRLKQMEQDYPGTRRGLHAGTMYRRYLDPSGYYKTPNGDKAYSYRYLVENADALMLKAKTPAASQNLQARIDQARTVLTNVVRSFHELAGTNRLITEFRPGEFEQDPETGDWTAQQGRMTHRIFGYGSANEIKNEINRQLDLGFVASGNDAIVVDIDYRKQWVIGSESDEEQGFTINEQGVFMPDGTQLVASLSKGFSLKNRDAELINGFFAAAGYVPHTKTIELLLDETGHKLSRIIGFWSMAIHASLHQIESGRVNEELFSRKKLQESKSAGMGSRTSADLHSSREMEGEEYPLPSTLIGINESLSEIETASQGRSHLPRLMGVNGKPIHSINLGNLKTMLLPASDGTTYSSKALEEYAEVLVSRDPALRTAEGVWLNPYLDPINPARISNVFVGSGMKDMSRGIGKEVLRMTELDIASEQLDLFAQHLLSGGRSERIVLGTHPDGDRNNITYVRLDDPFGNDRRVFVVDGKSVRFDRTVLRDWVKKAFAYHYEQHKVSKARWAKHAGSDLQTIMADPDMMRYRDYIVKGDKAVPGNAAEFTGSGIYNLENYKRILASSNDGSLDSAIASIFKPYADAFVTKLFGKKAVGEEPAVEGLGYRWQPAVVKRTTPASRQAMVEGLFYMTHLNDLFLSAALNGSQFNYKNAQDFIKRSVMMQSPGHLPMPIQGGLGQQLQLAVLAEPVEGEKALDGQSYILPWAQPALKASFGGNEGVFRPTVNKMVIVQNDLMEKSSQLPITHETYQKNPWLADQVKRSLAGTPELLAVWNAAIGESTPQQFAAAVQAVQQAAQGQVNEKGEVLKPEIPLIAFLSSESNVKMGLRGVNPGTDSALNALNVDVRSLRLQTNLERSLKSLRAPYFAQFSALMGVSPDATALVDQLNQLEADLTDKYLNDTRARIDRMPYDSPRERTTAWLKQLGIRKTADQGTVGQVVDMLSDPDGSVNNPLVRRKLMEFVANELTTDAINPKMNGQMFTQASGHGFLHIPLPETPAVTQHPDDTSGREELGENNDAVPGTGEEGQDSGIREGATAAEGTGTRLLGEANQSESGATSPDQLEPPATTQDGVEAQQGMGAPQPIAFRPPRIEGGKYARGEVMMPFLYAAEFGFEGEAWRDMTYQEIRTEIYSRLKEEGVKAFDRAMNVFVVRTPASGLGSGHMMKVVGFMNYSGNTVFTPPEMNKYTGGDFDGDQLTVYLRKYKADFDAEGKHVGAFEEVRSDMVEGIQSRILDVVEAFYMGHEESGLGPVDPSLILQPVGTAELEKAFEQVKTEQPDLYARDPVSMELFTPTHSIAARRMAADGVTLIGIGAQYMKGYSFLSQALNHSEAGDGTFTDWTPKLIASGDTSVALNISQLLNGMLDNTKLMVIGEADINEHNVGLIMGAVMDGQGLPGVIALAKDPLVVQAVQKLEKQNSLNLGDQVRNRSTMLDMLIEMAGVPAVEGEEVSSSQQLAHWAAVGEAVGRMSRIYSMGTQGIPIDDHGLDSLTHHIEATTSARISDLINGSLPTPDYYQLIEPKQRNRFTYQSREQLVRSLFDPRKVLQLQPNTMAQVRALDWINQMYGEAFLQRHPALIGAFKQFTYDVGRNEVLSENGRKVYNHQFTSMMISLFMDQQYGKAGSDLITTSKGRSYGLGDKGGQLQFVMDFPTVWKDAVDQVLRLPQDHPARVAYQSNRFLQEVEITGRSALKVQMRDGRRISHDPRLNEQVRRDASRIDRVFGHSDLGGMPYMQQLLSIYSMLKDRFSFDRNSFAPFITSTEIPGFDNVNDGMLEALHRHEKEIKLYPLSNGTTVSVDEILREFTGSLPVTEGQLVPLWSKKESPTYTTFYATKKRVGYHSFFEVRDVRARDLILSNPASKLAPQIHPGGGNVMPNINVYRNLDRVTYENLMSGQPRVTVTLEQGQNWDLKKPLLLPTGHAVQIISVDPATNTAVVDASSIGTPQVSNNEDAPPGINKMATVEGGVITGQGASYHGAFNGMLNELSLTNGLKRVSMLSIAPHYRELAKFLLEQQAIVERSGQIFTMDHANKYWMGSIEDDGRINLSRTISGLDADATLLHEVIHRFVSWTQNAPVDQLDARGLAFRRGMEDLYMEARAKLPNSKLYGFKNVQEFVAEGMTNPEFQNELRKIDGGPKQQSLWRRFVAWVNKLIGIQTDQTVLERLMDQTYGYIRYTSEQGQSFNEQVERGELYGMNKMADAASHGVHPNRPPVEDIRDLAPHLMSSSKSEVSFDSLERDELTNYIFNNQIDRKTNFQVVDGVRFNIAGMDDATLREYLYETVVPQLRKQFGYRKDDLAYVFNHKDFQAGWKAVFKDMRGEVLDSDVLRDQVAEQIGHQEGDVYLRYSWLKDTEKIIERIDQPSIKVGDLGLQHIEAFEGYDPIIQVRQSSKGKPVITLVDVVNTYLNDRKDPNVGPKLLSNYATFGFAQSALGMVTPNNEGGMRQFLLALTAMAMEQSMPGLKINRMKVLGVKGGNLQDQSPWMYDVLKEVEILKKTPLYRIMPDKIKAVLDDKRLFDAKVYNQDYSEHYMNALRKAQQAGKEGLGDELSVLHLSNAEERAVTGQAGAFTDRIRMKALTHRMNELIRLRKDTVEQDPEYKLVSRAIVELKERATKGMNSNRDTSKIGANIKNMMDVQSDLQQVAIRANEMATAKISGIMNPWHKGVEGWISELDKVVWSTGKSAAAAVVDLGHKRYERIFRMSATTEADVALGMDAVYANTDDMRILAPARTNSVHWNERDPYTAHLLKTNQLTRAEVEFGNKVATEVQSLLVDALVHKWEFDGVEHRSKTTGVFDRSKAKEAAVVFVGKRYPKGHIPVMPAPFSEQISQGKIASSLKALWNANTNVDNLFDEDLDPTEKVPSYKVANRYLGELSYQQSGSPLGSSIRLSRMGLIVRGIDGATVLDDPKLNERSTQNLEVMLAKLKLAVTRQIVHETETIPVANSVRSVLAMMEIESSKGQVYNREMLNDLLDRVRGGSGGGEKGGVSIAGVSMMPAVNLLMTYTSLAGVAVSWKVGLASALYSAIGSIGTAISSDVANDGLAGTKELAQATKILATKEGYRKIGALMDFYGVWDNQENDMAGSYLKTKSRKLIFSGHGLNILNWYSDHKMRGLAMAAQMIKDGNFDAHSLDSDGNMVYDQMKDRRFYKADGTITEDGRILMNGLKERLVDEGTRGQTMDKPLKAAYDSQSQRILKWISDKYIQGGMDRSQQGYMNNVWYGRMFTTFRKFLETRIGHWYLRPTTVDNGGQWKVGVDPTTGERVEQWEKREVTSYIYALISSAAKIKEGMQMGWGEVEGLSKAEKRSLSRLAVDMTFFCLLFMLFKALDPDDEERKEMRRKGIKRTSAEVRLTTMFQDMAWDQFAGSPWSITDTFSGYHGNPIPALGTARTLLDMTTDISKVKDLLPGKTTARDLYDLYQRSQDQP